MTHTPAPLLMLAAGPSPVALLLPAWAGSGKRRVLVVVCIVRRAA